MRTLREITVEVIQKCNSNCIYCSSFSGKDSNHEICIDKLKEIALFSKEKGASEINISGGEPFLKEDLLEYVFFINDLGLNVNIYTSGNFELTQEIKKKLLNYSHKEKGSIIFNYCSCEPKVFNQIVADSNFGIENINENLMFFINSGYNVEVHTVPNVINLDTLYNTAKNLKNMGVNKLRFLRMVYQARAKQNKEILEIKDNDKLLEIINKIQTNLCDSEFSFKGGIPYSNYTKEQVSCNAGFNKLIIKYDGNVFPCEAFKEAPNKEEYILGNIYNDQIETIWKNYYQLAKLPQLKKFSKQYNEPCPAQILYTGAINA
jgi:radical SAM protein with 4Fe4S-binding SPASM domain